MKARNWGRLVACLGLWVSFCAWAGELKVGVIDMRLIAGNSPQAQETMNLLKKEFKGREDQIISTEKTLKEKAEKLQRNAAVMSESEKAKLERDLTVGQRELQRLQTEFREDAALRQQEEMKKLLDKINQRVEAIAKAKQFDLILYRDAVPFATPQIDITDEVMKAI